MADAATGGGDDRTLCAVNRYRAHQGVARHRRPSRGSSGAEPWQVFIHPGERSSAGICPRSGAHRQQVGSRASRACRWSCIPRRTEDAGSRRARRSRAGRRGRARRRMDAVPAAGRRDRGRQDPDEFLLVHGHYDSWDVGIGDNATGDAVLLELARIFHGMRDPAEPINPNSVVAGPFDRALRDRRGSPTRLPTSSTSSASRRSTSTISRMRRRDGVRRSDVDGRGWCALRDGHR